MVYTTEPDFGNFIERLAVILEASLLVFPKSASGGNPEASDLLNKVYRFQPPVPENPDTGIGPPFAFITTPDKVVITNEQIGRDSRDQKGGQRKELEFYCVIVTFDTTTGRTGSEASIYPIISAIKTTLYKNIRLLDPANPVDATRLCSTLELFDVPFVLNTDEKSIIARNIVIRPKLETKFT